MGAVLVWPIFGHDYPPGVDTPTFLHLSWVTNLAVSGQLADPFQDPYWYGGFSYLVAYPPLGYGLVGILTVATRLELTVVYSGLLVLSYGALATATYWLAAELGLRRWTAALTGILVALAYPVLSAIFLWGWFTSVMALPFALVAIMLLERSLKSSNWRPAGWAGVFMALSILTHHMTGLSIGLGLVGWFVFNVAAGVYPRRQVVVISGLFAGITALIVAPWGAPFLMHMLDAGFRREVPGLWLPDLAIYRDFVSDRSLIGQYVYPSYLGIPFMVLATGGTVYALLERRALGGIALALLVLTWFSMGANLNPLIRLYPFSGLDTARFHLYMAPFMVILGGALVERVFGFLRDVGSTLSSRLGPGTLNLLWYTVVIGVLAAVLVVPMLDAQKAREHMRPYQVEEQVDVAIRWLSESSSGDERQGPIYSIGLWNWDSFLVPYLAGRPLIDGWHDEGASNVGKIRRLRIMGWTGDVDIGEAHRILLELGASNVLINRISDYPAEASDVFWNEIEAHPKLFEKQEQWGDVAVFRVLQ